MAIRTLSELINLEQIRLLLEAHYKITGICSAVVDAEDNVLVAVGWSGIGDSVRRSTSGTCGACREESAAGAGPAVSAEGCREGCRQMVWDVALPILIEGRHLGTFFTGQFLNRFETVCPPLLMQQGASYRPPQEGALLYPRPPLSLPRNDMKHLIDFFQVLVQIVAQMAGKNLELAREMEERHKAERARRESREFLEKIVNSISDPIFVKDREHRLVLVNEAVCSLAGLRRDDLVGRTNDEVSLAQEVDVLWETDEVVFITGKDAVREEELTDAQGGRRVVLTRKSLYRGMDGEYLVGIIRDITERKRAEEDIALLNFALDNVHEAAYLMDEQARFLYVNEAACRALGYPREELLSMRLPEIAPDRPHERWVRDWEKLKESGSLTFESRHKTRSGRVFPVQITANYFEYDRTGYTLALVRDLTPPAGPLPPP